MKAWLKTNGKDFFCLIAVIIMFFNGMAIKWLVNKDKMIIIKDPVLVYENGTTMVVNHEGVFSYSGALGIVSQRKLLDKIGISEQRF